MRSLLKPGGRILMEKYCFLHEEHGGEYSGDVYCVSLNGHFPITLQVVQMFLNEHTFLLIALKLQKWEAHEIHVRLSVCTCM